MYIFQPDRILIQQQLKKIGHYITGRVLDVGAGKVRRYQKYFKADNYITLDCNPDYQPDILVTADKIPLKDGEIDSIVCTALMGDLPDLKKAITEFHRVLKPKGKILITEYFMDPMHEEPIDFWRFTPYGLEKLFSQNDFKKIFLQKRGGFFTTLLQLKIRYLIDKFNLYNKQWTRIFNPIFKLFFKLAQVLDKLDKSKANSRFSLGWTGIFEKI